MSAMVRRPAGARRWLGLAVVVLAAWLVPAARAGAVTTSTGTELPTNGTSTGVAMSGSLALVGEDPGINGQSGGPSVAVFKQGSGGWSQVATLAPPTEVSTSGCANSNSPGCPGWSVALDASGSTPTAVVGGNGSEVDVYIQGNGGSWTLQQRIPAPADMTQVADFAGWDVGRQFGGVTVSGDTLAIGGPREGAVWVYTRNPGGNWRELKKLTGTPGSCSPSCGFGRAITLSGSRLLVGSPSDGGDGIAYLFDVARRNWSPVRTFAHPDPAPECARQGETSPCRLGFGSQVALDGGTAVIAETSVPQSGACGGATVPGRCDWGAAYVFTEGSSPSSWQAQPTRLNSVPFPDASDSFGTYLAVSGSRIVAGSSDGVLDPCCSTPPAYVFTLDAFGVWEPAEELQGPAIGPTQSNAIAPSGDVGTNGTEEIVAPGVLNARVYP